MNEKWELIKKLDLSSVKDKFKAKKGLLWKWSNDADKIESEYRQFLYLAVTHPNEVVVPWNQNLDDFWHEHILDTMRYEKDCLTVFGKMFHHNPNLPKGSYEQTKAFTKTKEVYKETFGDKAKKQTYSDPGCSGATFVPVFCGGGDSSHDGASCGSSDSGASCGGGSSCGSSCGGGCGGGGD